MNPKERLLDSLPVNRSQKDYVIEYLFTKTQLQAAGFSLTQLEYADAVGIAVRTLQNYLSKYLAEVIEELKEQEAEFSEYI